MLEHFLLILNKSTDKNPAFSLSLVTALPDDNNDGIGGLKDLNELIQHQNFLD